MRNIAAWVSGLVMGFGLMMSGMVNPQKVIGFLDVFGNFDPSLAFVMAGALMVAGIGFRLSRLRTKPLAAESFDVPGKTEVDRPLILGSVLFGVGWGLAGFCPGPVIVSAGLGYVSSILFFLAMLAGMGIARQFQR